MKFSLTLSFDVTFHVFVFTWNKNPCFPMFASFPVSIVVLLRHMRFLLQLTTKKSGNFSHHLCLFSVKWIIHVALQQSPNLKVNLPVVSLTSAWFGRPLYPRGKFTQFESRLFDARFKVSLRRKSQQRDKATNEWAKVQFLVRFTIELRK